MGVVAIIAIVMAVAFPAAMSIRSNLRAMELNAKAQQVYNQAQSRLTSLQTDGSLGELETTLGTAKKLASAPTAPAAYQYASGKTTDWSKYGMYEVASGDSAVTKYLVTSDTSLGASGSLTGSYVIELSPSTGEVYAVYYWEGDVSGSTDYPTISVQDAKTLTANHIGYYGGKSIDPAITHKNVTQFSDLGFSLVNDEELYARVISKDFSKAVFDPSKLSVTIKVTGTSILGWGSATWSKTYTGGNTQGGFSISPTTNEVDIILDSMRDGLSFSSITGGLIIPGSDVNVSVSVTYNENTYDASNRTGMQDRTTNSLYGSLNENTKTIQVGAVRHLNNMRTGIYSRYWDINEFSKVSQTDDIDFDGADWATTPECVSVQSRKAQSDNGWNPLTEFEPIDNAYYNNNWGGRTFDGASHKIKNFVIVGSESTFYLTGLFPYSWVDFSNVFMTDTKVTGTGIYTGGLVGLVYSGTLTNCHNDVTKTDADGKLLLADHAVTGSGGCVGGLVGEIASSSTVTNCSATTNVTSTYGSYAGGLIGWLQGGGSKIADCSVGSESGVVTVSGYGTYVGGMVGKHDGSGGLSGCSAFANVNATSVYGGFAAGLVGYLYNGGAPITKCSVGSEKSPVTVTCYGSYVGGIVGCDLAVPGSPALEDCTAFANVTSTNGGLAGGLAGQVSQTTTIANCGVGSAKTVVTIAGAKDGIGGLIGQSNAQTVSGCAVVANVSGSGSYVGGLIGDEKNTSMVLDGCSEGVGAATDPKNAVTVSGVGYVGGLCGIFRGGSLTNSDAVANIVSTDDYAGGLCGSSTTTWATIDTCHFDAGLTTSTNRIIAVDSAGNYVGGLAGSLAGGTTLKNCTVGSGGNVLLQVNGSAYSGGAIGYSSNATVSDTSVLCTSVASDYYYVGGFVGILSAGSVTNCHAIGNPDYDDNSGGRSSVSTTAVANGYGFLGGFAGQLGSCTVSGCYADSNVIGSGCAYVGGFVGVAGGGEISSCYSSGQVQGYIGAGGFVGRCNASSIHDCFSTSDVLGSANVGGFFGSVYSSYTYSNDTSYGRVCLANGGTPSGASGFGGFVGYNSGRTNSGNLSNCTYLKMTGYNDDTISNAATLKYQPAGTGYNDLLVENPTTDTHPYKASLKGKTFPFAMVGSLPYYGDWQIAACHVKFVDHDGKVLQEGDVVPGATASYDKTTNGTPTPYVADGHYWVWAGTWSPALGAVTADTTYVAQYVKLPSGPEMIAGGTSYNNLTYTLWGVGGPDGYFTQTNSIRSKNYAKSPFSNSNQATVENGNHAVDSEADYSTSKNAANAATSVRNQLSANYPLGVTSNSSGSFSFRICISDWTAVVTTESMKNYLYYNTSTNSLTDGGLVVLVGEKIPNASTITAAEAAATYNVIEYDAFRAANGLPPYRLCTIGITNKNPLKTSATLSYYVYNYASASSFTSTGNWFTM